jgi:hypothetical protein
MATGWIAIPSGGGATAASNDERNGSDRLRTRIKPLITRNINGVIQRRHPAKYRPGCHVSLGNKRAACFACEQQNVDPTYVIGDVQHIAPAVLAND